MTTPTLSAQRLSGKIALVSGGSSGIGRATVNLFALHGAKVVVIDRDPPFTSFPDNVVLSTGSVAAEADWQAAVELAVTTYGASPDVLVQCAGISGKARIHEATLEEWERVFSVNTTGVFLGMKTVIGALLKDGRPGAIVNISSISGLRGMKTGVAYEASKGGCTQLTRSAAVDYAKDNIRVNAVHPGLTKTEMIIKANRPTSAYEVMMAHTPLNRWGTPEEVALAILYLSSDEASFVTGLMFTHDGGFTAM